MPTRRTAGTIQDFSYNFEVQTGNLLSRTDNKRTITESFQYDNLNRLTNVAGSAIVYGAIGNITQLPGIGTMDYTNAAKPYAVTMLTPEGNAVPVREQTITYSSFQRPVSITENGYNAAFTYDAAGDRVKMSLTQNGTAVLTRYYMGGQYETDVQTGTERLYLGGDAYSSPTVYVKEAGVWKIYYICRDYLGSMTHITNSSGLLIQELSYDAWGRLRNPATQVAYAPGSEPALLLGRGYTGHEHLTMFGLINMNARLYDPALGRFLSPDPYVQMPDFTQNFNRYSYCLNNPLRYTDPEGDTPVNLVAAGIGAVIGGVINLSLNWNNCDGFWEYAAAFGVGAVGGAASGALLGTDGGASFWAVVGVGAASGALTAGTNDIIAQTSNNFQGSVDWNHVGQMSTSGFVAGGLSSAVGYSISSSTLINGSIKSPMLRSLIASPVTSGVGHWAGGTTYGMLNGQSFSEASNNAFDGIGNSMVIGTAIGLGSTYISARANKINPWSGKSVYNGRVVTNPDGSQAVIDIPSNYSCKIADNGNGMVYQAPGSTEYAPNGYAVFYNRYGQPYNPSNGLTLSRNTWHFLFK